MIKRIVSLCLLLSIAMFGLFSPLRGNTPAEENLVKQAIAQGALLVDVRSPEEFASGSAQGAINIPLDQLSHRTEELREALQAKGAIVVFCRSGKRASSAKEILEQTGLSPIINGGTWQRVQGFIEAVAQDARDGGSARGGCCGATCCS